MAYGAIRAHRATTPWAATSDDPNHCPWGAAGAASSVREVRAGVRRGRWRASERLAGRFGSGSGESEKKDIKTFVCIKSGTVFAFGQADPAEARGQEGRARQAVWRSIKYYNLFQKHNGKMIVI
ncbi:hypothetical protein GCM10023158_00500 [Gluconacetobacter tumulicola]